MILLVSPGLATRGFRSNRIFLWFSERTRLFRVAYTHTYTQTYTHTQTQQPSENRFLLLCPNRNELTEMLQASVFHFGGYRIGVVPAIGSPSSSTVIAIIDAIINAIVIIIMSRIGRIEAMPQRNAVSEFKQHDRNELKKTMLPYWICYGSHRSAGW